MGHWFRFRGRVGGWVFGLGLGVRWVSGWVGHWLRFRGRVGGWVIGLGLGEGWVGGFLV